MVLNNKVGLNNKNVQKIIEKQYIIQGNSNYLKIIIAGTFWFTLVGDLKYVNTRYNKESGILLL